MTTMWRVLALACAIAVFPPLAAAQVATVAEGALSGMQERDVSVFYGVPFAAPPVGALRWAAPQPAVAWQGPRAANRLPASCPQVLMPDGFMMYTREYLTPAPPGVSEDCLFANIWTPQLPGSTQARAALPVLVFIHGGGYTSGSGTVPIYNGANLARKELVVVTINYRLSALGFLAHPELTAEQGGASGNYAIQDQIQALRWIQRNIAAFGGDPSKVTIAGQSAGAGSVLALLVSPQAKGLFRNALVQSAPGMGDYPLLTQAEQRGAALLRSWGVDSIAAARALPAEKLAVPAGPAGGGSMIADGKVIPRVPSPPLMASDVPVMVGYTFNDLFAVTRKLTAAQWQVEARQRYGGRAAEFLRYYPGGTDAEASRSATRESVDRSQMAPILQWMATRGANSPVYAYLFSHVEPGPKSAEYGAFHSSDLPYMFDTLSMSPERNFTEVDRRVVEQFGGAVVNFVKTGKPEGGSVPAWPALTQQGKAVMEFGDEARLVRVYPAGADAVMAAGRAPQGPPAGAHAE
ncbi:MAG: carboxylesterase family protein [Steroidobacteraceae bacterium]